MTDNTQAELRDRITKKVAASYGVAKDETIADVMAIVRDWHNKQTERLLNEILVDVADPNANIDQAEMIELINLHINKLKESTNGKTN